MAMTLHPRGAGPAPCAHLCALLILALALPGVRVAHIGQERSVVYPAHRQSPPITKEVAERELVNAREIQRQCAERLAELGREVLEVVNAAAIAAYVEQRCEAVLAAYVTGRAA